MKKTYLLFGLVALLCVAAGVFLGMRQTQPSSPDDAAVAKLLAMSLPDAKGEVQSLNQWKNKPLVVNFWATWCAPCVQEMPELSALQQEIAARNIQIIGVGIDSRANIAQFAEKYKIAYPLYIAGIDASELSRQLGNKAGGLPFTVLVNREGKVVKSYLGRLKIEELRKELAVM